MTKSKIISLKDCFVEDTDGFSLAQNFLFHWKNEKDNNGRIHNFDVEITYKISMPWLSDRALHYIYIPQNDYPLDVCYRVLSNFRGLQKDLGVTEFRSGLLYGGSIEIGLRQSPIIDKVFIYLENLIVNKSPFYRKNILDDLAKELGITVFLREEEYRKEREKSMKLLAFISHDSRDKELIARPIAHALQSKLYNVWFDDFSLKIGDNLRDSIEKGIKESNKCILILTPNFLSNPGWTKKEFDSIFTKEMVKGERVILPIWYKVSVDDIYEYSPSLANTVALHWPERSKLSSDKEYNEAISEIAGQIIKQLDKTWR